MLHSLDAFFGLGLGERGSGGDSVQGDQGLADRSAGGTVVGYSDPDGFYIHAKAIVADYGLSTQAVEAGSMNLSSNSPSNNRELGIILTGTGIAQPVASTIETTFTSDYAGGT